jgi:hypothetical protein
LFWFLALLSNIKTTGNQEIKLADVLAEMVVAAWHPVCLFRLSLGSQDKLQETIVKIQASSRLPSNAKPETIRGFIHNSPEARARLDYFKRYVPTRFLTPWFEDELRGMTDASKSATIRTLARNSQSTPFASLYHLEATRAGETVTFNGLWWAFLVENLGIVESFIEHRLALYLQARNPNVPGVLGKLRAPTARQLRSARTFWRLVQEYFRKTAKSEAFVDIYSQKGLGATFAIDHFLPWSFVAHDLLWNLTPVEQETNSSKGDALPELDTYLPRLAKLHFGAVGVARQHPEFIGDYSDCFKQDLGGLLALGEDGFAVKYREIILPQAQIARNQGFPSGWTLRR